MNNLAQKKPDYVFIASLIAIIFVAVYLAMDRFKDSDISSYLHQKGQELLAQIDNQEERENLQTEYNQFIEKVTDREVDPEKVEQFVSSIINLNQAKDNLNKDEFVYLFHKNLQKVVQADTVQKVYDETNERWNKLQERLLDLNVFEEKVKEAAVSKSELKNSYTFSYTIDDTLNIIISEDFKENMVNQVELAKELKRLENENTLKWHKEADAILEKQKALHKVLIKLEEAEAAMSVIAIGKDTVNVTAPALPVIIESSKAPTTEKK